MGETNVKTERLWNFDYAWQSWKLILEENIIQFAQLVKRKNEEETTEHVISCTEHQRMTGHQLHDGREIKEMMGDIIRPWTWIYMKYCHIYALCMCVCISRGISISCKPSFSVTVVQKENFRFDLIWFDLIWLTLGSKLGYKRAWGIQSYTTWTSHVVLSSRPQVAAMLFCKLDSVGNSVFAN